MIAYWDRDCEWMSHGLISAVSPSFTGPTGLAALDVSQRSNHGVLTNMDRNTAWQASVEKTALDFNGINSAVNCGTRVPRLGNGHTFSAWVFKRANGGMIAGMCDSIAVGGIEWADLSGSFAIAFFDGSIRGWFLGPTLPSQAWSFVCAVFTTTQIRMTVNATTTITAITTNGIVYNNDLWRIGVASTGNPFWNGFIDDVRLSDRALSTAEVRALYERDRSGGMLHRPVNQRSYYAQLAAAFSILAESGSYALNGHPIPLLYGRALSADTGSVLLSGQTTSLLTSRLLNADQGSYAYSGTDAATLLGRLLDAGAAAYTLDGNAAGFLVSRRISADTVAYLASGLDAGFLRSRVLEAGTGQYVLVASPVNLQTGTPGTGGAAPYYYLFLLGGSR